MKTFTVKFTGTMIMRVDDSVGMSQSELREFILSGLLSAEIAANLPGNPRIHITGHEEPSEMTFNDGTRNAPTNETGC